MNKYTFNEHKNEDMQRLFTAILNNDVLEAKRIIDLDIERSKVGADTLCNAVIDQYGQRMPFLCLAAQLGHLQLVDHLIRGGAHLELDDIPHDAFRGANGTALIRAAQMGHQHVVKRLIDAGDNINYVHHCYPRPRTALSMAVAAGHVEVVSELIKHGANYHHECLNDAFDSAISQGDLRMMTLLFQLGALDTYLKDQQRTIRTCVQSSPMSQHIVSFLMDHGITNTQVWIMALDDAGAGKGDQLLRKLSTIILSLRERKLYSDSPVEKEILTNLILRFIKSDVLSYRLVAFFLNHGVDIHHQDSDGLTLLMSATGVKSLASLLDHGADYNAKDNHGQTALHRLAPKGSRAKHVMTELLERHSCVDALDNLGQTPLMIASSSIIATQPQIINLLIDRGASIDHQDNKGQTALFLAVDTALAAINLRTLNSIKTLLDRKANPFIANKDGLTIMAMIERDKKSKGERKETLSTLLCAAMENYKAISNHYTTIYQHRDYSSFYTTKMTHPAHHKQFIKHTNMPLLRNARVFDASTSVLFDISRMMSSLMSIYQHQKTGDWHETSSQTNDGVFTVTKKIWFTIRKQQDDRAASNASSSSAAAHAVPEPISVYQHQVESYWQLHEPDPQLRHEFRKATLRRDVWDLIKDQIGLRENKKRSLVFFNNHETEENDVTPPRQKNLRGCPERGISPRQPF